MFLLKEKFKSFLESNGFLPLSEWSSFEFDHGDPAVEKVNCIKIKREVADKSGLYIYLKDDRVLYIGKAKLLLGRIKSHYHESFKDPGHVKAKPWHVFFSSNKGSVKVLWKEVEIEQERQIVEKMLEYVIPSEFMAFKNKFEK